MQTESNTCMVTANTGKKRVAKMEGPEAKICMCNTKKHPEQHAAREQQNREATPPVELLLLDRVSQTDCVQTQPAVQDAYNSKITELLHAQ